jgi:chemotaxis protein MotB
MMAFFLLLWLLNAVSQEQLEGISDYFSPISTHTSTSGGGGLLQGRSLAAKGVFQDERHDDASPDKAEDGFPQPGETGKSASAPGSRLDATTLKRARDQEKADFVNVEQELRSMIDGDPELAKLAGSIRVDQTPEGLRIQIVDQDGMPMFPRGQAILYGHTRRLLEKVARVIAPLSQAIDISGHTDVTAFARDAEYSNWELSADRANAARRTLAEFGVAESRIGKVIGRAATDPLLPERPEAAGNRRLTIVLQRLSPSPHKTSDATNPARLGR